MTPPPARTHDSSTVEPAGLTGLTANLRILETTDLHANLLPYDYFTDRPAPATGLAQTAAMVRRLRGEVANCLLFDNGDSLQGNPLADWIAAGDVQPHPVIAAMNTLGYDAGTLGNHEFDYGLGFLLRAIAAATFPLVSANTFRQAEDGPQPIVPRFAMLDRQILASDGQRHRLRVGVIGFAPPTLVNWNRIVLAGQVTTCDIVEAAAACVPHMLAAGADLIIALCHSGIGATTATPDMENAAVPLAAVPGIDVLLTGHTHQLFPGPATPASAAVDPVGGGIHGKPTVMAGSNGSHVGVIDLTLTCSHGRWRPLSHAVCTEPVSQMDGVGCMTARLADDARVVEVARPSHDAVLSLIRRPIGQTEVPLHSYFALVAPDRTLELVADALMARASRMVQGTRWAGVPILAAVAPTLAGSAGRHIDIPPGGLLLRHAAELCVFPNTLCVLAVNGQALRAWLEHAAGQFRHIALGVTDQPLIAPDFPSYNFDVIAGLTYVIDPAAPGRTDAAGAVIDPRAQRIRDLCWEGRPVRAGQRFLIATNSYRVGGGGSFAAATGARTLCHSTESTRDILIDYLRRAGPVRPAPRLIWRFAAHPGTGAWIDTGVGALAHMADAPDLRAVGAGHNGAQRFVLSFGP